MSNVAVLHSYFRSSCSWRVRIALNYKQIQYKQKAVHLLNNGGEQHSDEYKSVNPMEQELIGQENENTYFNSVTQTVEHIVVPTLVIDGLTLTQSLPIMEYLEESRPDINPLLPGDPKDRVRVRQIAEIINSGIQPVQNLSILQAVGPERKMKWGHDAIHKGFVAIEDLLKSHSTGKYCIGDSVTIADICLVPQVYNASRFKVDMALFPNIARINSALEELPEFQKAHFTVQPDTPEELKKS